MIIYNGKRMAVKVVGYGGSGGESGTAITVTTAEDMETILANATSEDNGKVYLYTGETTDTYTQGAYYRLEV